MADALAINMYRGDSYPIFFTFTDKATGEPIDLTGATAKLTIDTAQNPTSDATKVFSVNAVIDTDPLTGKMSFTPTTTDTATIGKYYYDVQLTIGATVRTVVKSTFAITMDITK